MFFEIAHDSTGRTEAEGASSRQKDGIHFIYHLQRMQHIGFMGRWSASANINAANGGHIAEKNCTTRSCPQVGIVAHTPTKDIRDVIVPMHTSAFLITPPFFSPVW